LLSFYYDQELTYSIDNPCGSALFQLRVVTIEGQERDNQMTTGVIQSADFQIPAVSPRDKASPMWLATGAGVDEDLRRKYKQNAELPRLISKLMRMEGRRTSTTTR
jgi:hypothetical protein